MREPRVFTIPTGAPFLPTLAEALLDGTLTAGWPDGTELADATIYLPTRRAGRAFAAHLAARLGRPLSVLTERGNTGRAEDFTLIRFARQVAPGEILPVSAATADDRALLAA